MRFIKYSLMLLGVIALFITLGLSYAFLDSRSAASDGKIFASRFLSDFSDSWDPDSVKNRFTNDNLAQFESADGARILQSMSTLGRFQTMDEFSVLNHTVMTSGTVSVFEFTGQFENDDALIRMRVIKDDGRMQVKDLALIPNGPIARKQDRAST